MARLKIDLLPKKASEIKKINKTIFILRTTAEVIAGLLLVSIIGVFVWLFLTNLELQRVGSQVGNAQLQLEQSGEEEVKYRLYQEILSRSDQIIKERKDYKGIFDDVYALVPEDVFVSGINFEGQTVIFDGRARGVQAFSRAIDNFLKIGSGQVARFKDVAMINVSRLGDAFYSFKLEIGLSGI